MLRKTTRDINVDLRYLFRKEIESSGFSFRDILNNFTLFAKTCLFMNNEIRVFEYLHLDRHRMVPISARRFRVLEGFPTRIQPREWQAIMSRLSRVYLEQAYMPWYQSYCVNRFGERTKIKSQNRGILFARCTLQRHFGFKIEDKKSNSGSRRVVLLSLLNRLIDCTAAASLNSLISCTCSARMRHSVIIFI